ncbi:two-component system response regulator AtoC [Caldalkalibacillus uzonensis]|uniref:Two-component system response regulator AtoC n=1 Tax=Caldalkalibacillus uzonensis TaxID=353224 RepID=A0ABU0CQR5_9BACI|nr:sigma-54 dependent transcriptional regulator [Caldalkalibacillus uzonensis]MDQ0338236.1 two-component system response regulator AtoC [Caldalkalibacillus uzonensis]
MAKILVIDDEASICSSLQFALEDEYEVKTTTDPWTGVEWLKQESFDLCLLDLKLGEINGIDVLTEIKKWQPDMVVIIMTAYGTISSSVEAIKKGAYSYLTKPLHMEELLTLLKQALHFQHLYRQVAYLRQELENKYRSEGIIGKSPRMRRVFELIDKVKDIETNVLISGESGTGKELVARAIHFSGKRKNQRFEVVNCAAIPDQLLESELFGHEKGAFTGAVSRREGKFQLAQNGTIFLDEIGDMPLHLQAKLLRVLQQREVTPLGANKSIKLNVRVIAATHRDLKKMVEEGTFREDLYFRLNVLEISLPPLRDRRQDLPFLIQHFIQVFNQELGKQIAGVVPDAYECLLNYHYPGNVRELANIVEAAMVICEGDQIQLKDLPEEVRHNHVRLHPGSQSIQSHIEALVGLPVKKVEELLIKATLEKNRGHRKQTAKMLGISERSLRDKLKQYKGRQT